ncbi:cation-translocating P-type ATPase [Eoetvoesiella caeni]|uniref:P-type Cu(+) transporter n=1 Tax=Eoetvoesiella caeni TaxID=645616 RepID=A0A366HIX0_9BURK|nr:cation-translocating P-type ATPase [Eoetvoesiella caeni]MCI2807694.1 cation-translocating P-type ATPase [Eoetvoesiella caeni]NYT52911.1 cation-translocating P-type ATPase [Eoetvoesiella caeni]RBP42888.1 Ca2+-transporting ATPase [Eoetvoesiella caeni]
MNVGSGAQLPPGLSSTEAACRLLTEGPNRLPDNARKSVWTMLGSVAAEPMFIMLLSASGIYLLLGDKTEAAFLMASVFIVISITLLQQRRARRALEALRDLSAPLALVIRDGQPTRIPGPHVVRGDLLVLHEGDRIAADGVLLRGSISVDESLLSGEAIAIEKVAPPVSESTVGAAPVADASNAGLPLLFASTVVTKGEGVVQITAIGTETAVGRIGESLSRVESLPSGLTLASRRIVWQMTTLGLLIAALVFVVSWSWDGRPLLDSLLAAIALIMAVLPEEIPLVLTVFLALGAWRMAKKKVLTRQMSGLEALGAITILAVDKTGTITQNRMKVAQLSTETAQFHDDNSTPLPNEFHELCRIAMLASPADPFDPMEKAIQQFEQRSLKESRRPGEGLRQAAKYDLSSSVLAMTNVYSAEESSEYLIATKGAPETILDLCRLPERTHEAMQLRAAAMAESGLRVLGVAKGSWHAENLPPDQRDFNFIFLGFVGFVDPPRPDVKQAISECRSAGIRVIMMTGDHPATARAIGQQVGLSERLDLITGAEVAEMNDIELAKKLGYIDLCARLKPEQKLRLVQLLQRNGEVVAMTGDGVNDAPALQAANIGIAMGERGTDVAREAADLILMDDSFASIVLSVRQGRRIYDNITCAIRFIFAVHVPVVALALFPTLFHWPIVLFPLHIVLLELIIDPSCSIVFEAQPEKSDIMKRPPRELTHTPFSLSNLGYAIVQGVGISFILLLGYWMLGSMPALSETQERVIVYISLVAGVLLLVVKNGEFSVSLSAGASKSSNLLIGFIVLITGLLIAITTVPMANEIFQFRRPEFFDWGFAAIMVAIMAIWLETFKRAMQRYAN